MPPSPPRPRPSVGVNAGHATGQPHSPLIRELLATGRQAFSGSTSAAVFDAILNRAPVAPVRINPDVPAELERIINKTLEKDRGMRYQTAADLRTDL